jgi:hypothetical protein
MAGFPFGMERRASELRALEHLELLGYSTEMVMPIAPALQRQSFFKCFRSTARQRE